jgi:gluconate 5-dehydrogenase
MSAALPDADRRTVVELFDLRGKTALVTGAGGYLGSAFCLALAEAGASVVAASSKSLDRAAAVANSLPTGPGAVHRGVVLDQMDDECSAQGFRDAETQAGRIDILVNNGLEALAADWREASFAQFARHQANNAGYFCLARRLRDHAVAHGRPASVIMIGSMYGQVGSYPDAYEGVCSASAVSYHALKGGTLQMTRHLAVYWADDQVRVNCLSPGPFPNPATAAPEMVRRLCTKSPMRRMGAPAELKGALVFLASDASSYVTGQNLTVDGGWTAW